MSDYVLSCCSTADLTKAHFEERDISYICFHYEMDGKQYSDDLGQTMPFDVFYRKMAEGADTLKLSWLFAIAMRTRIGA